MKTAAFPPLLLLLAISLLPVHVDAQQAISPEELRVSSSSYTPPARGALHSDVKLVEVLAVVRDNKDHTVAGLTSADFEIHDEGKKREVTAFSVQQAPVHTVAAPATSKGTPELVDAKPSAPAAPAARSIALLFDDLNSKAEDFQHVRDAALLFAKEGLAPGDRVGIFTVFSSQVLSFTSDVAQLTAAIAKLNPRTREGNTIDCPYFTPYLAYVVANNLDREALAAKVAEMQSCHPAQAAAGTPAPATPSSGRGRSPKQTTGGPQVSPQDPTALKVIQIARMVWNEQEGTSKNTLGTIENVVDLLATQPGQRMLLLGSGGFLAGTLDLEQQTLITHAVHAGVVINSLDAKGLYTINLPTSVPGGVTGYASIYAAKLGTKDKDASNDVMENLSASTGGRFFRDSNDLAAGFSELTEVPEVSYLLGFSPPEPDGKFHHLKVQLPNRKGFTVQTRLGYISEKESAPREERKIDREVFTADQAHDATVGFDLTSEPSKTGANILKAVFHADVRTLPFGERSGVRTEKLLFLVAILDKDGNFVAGKEGSMEFALKPETFERLKGARLDASLQLETPPPGTYRLRVLIEEENGGKMTKATQPIQAK